MPVTIDASDLTASISRLLGSLNNTGPVYGKASRHMRDYVRQTITNQGRKRPYVPLAKMTRQRTGRRKALITLRKYIKASHDSSRAIVYFQEQSAAWNIDQHHTGYTIGPAKARMVVPRAGGGILAAFMSRGAIKVPAREVWPTERETYKAVLPIFKKWVDQSARKSWR